MKTLRQILRPYRSTVLKVLKVYGAVTGPYARLRLNTGLSPMSYLWGTDRGLPIHRYYLEQFLEENSDVIRGRCLEFLDDSYTVRFGREKVAKRDVLHIDDTNPNATIIADLTKPNNIQGDQFDCIICTHVLHVIFELDKVVAEFYRILKLGGVLLVGVPHISMCGRGYNEFWRFTPDGLLRLLSNHFGRENVRTRGYGNSLTAAGEIRGLVAFEFRKSELDYCDERFSVEVCGRAVKR
jgi:SAM-dependent methyltransferase